MGPARAFMASTRIVLVVAFALGAAHALSFAPWNLWWLQLAALAALFGLARTVDTPRGAAALGALFGLGWFGVGVSWVYISMHSYGGMPALLAAAATAAFCGFLALFPALALGVAAHWRAQPALHTLLLLPACWALAEWLRGVVLTGFPWIASGYAHTDGPLAGFAPLAGVYGVSLVAALVAGAAALGTSWATLSPRLRAGVAAILIGIAALGAALRSVEWTKPAGAPLAVRLIQGNIAQSLKFGPDGLTRGHRTHMDLLRAPGRVDLAVLPESVFPLPVNALPESVLHDLASHVESTSTTLIFGAFIEEPRENYYNSAIVMNPDRTTADYRKRHLVPFGEFIPFGFRWFVDLMRIPIGDQQRGAEYQAPFAVKDQRIAINICYEDLFGAQIIDAWRDPSREPTILLNLSNLAWFDDSFALHQHLQISRMRALETGRPMLRATNTGATAIIDARGRVVAALPHVTRGMLDGSVQGAAGRTPYVRFGDIAALTAIGLLLAGGLLLRRRGGRAAPGTSAP